MIKVFVFLLTAAIYSFGVQEKPMKQIRTYMPFTSPTDPAKIVIIPDMDLSYALGSTLVEWDSAKQISSGLAASWQIKDEKVYRFTLRQNAKWSDGSALTSEQVKHSLERGLKAYPESLRSLANILDRFECPDARIIDFKLKIPAQESNLLGKLTEPNYGILNVSKAGKLDLKKTTGAFSLQNETISELILKKNPYWHHTNTQMADEVIIRRPSPTMDAQQILFTDQWPNLIETSSLIEAETLQKYETHHFEVWKRPIDKIFLFQLGKRLVNADGLKLFQFLNAKLDRKLLTKNLSGFSLNEQIFPYGYQLHDLHAGSLKNENVTLPPLFKKKPLEILISPTRVNSILKENIRKAIVAAIGIEPQFISKALSEISDLRQAGNFDLYAGTMGLADPDPEGIMSFYFEGEIPVIYSLVENFVGKLDHARKEKNPETRLKLMRDIVTQATRSGHVLPLFHLSTIGLGRSELDFSQISTSDESVTLSKVRFKSKGPK